MYIYVCVCVELLLLLLLLLLKDDVDVYVDGDVAVHPGGHFVHIQELVAQMFCNCLTHMFVVFTVVAIVVAVIACFFFCS